MGFDNFLFEKTNLNSNLKSEWCLDYGFETRTVQ